jgi:hypothetical protein
VDNPDSAKDGFGDWQFLVKYRILSSNEEHGNYILTAFFSDDRADRTVHAGQPQPGDYSDDFVREGHRQFRRARNVGYNLPTGHVQEIGRTIPWNNTFQYHLWKKLWPETEVNCTRYYLGSHGGNTSVYLTRGLIIGRFRIHNCFAFAIGGGYEIAVTSFHPTNHVTICSIRFPF